MCFNNRYVYSLQKSFFSVEFYFYLFFESVSSACLPIYLFVLSICVFIYLFIPGKSFHGISMCC